MSFKSFSKAHTPAKNDTPADKSKPAAGVDASTVAPAHKAEDAAAPKKS